MSVLRLVMLVMLAALLAGCVRAEVELTITPERTVEGTVLLAWHTEFLERIDRDPAEAQQEILEDLTDDAPDGMACQPFEDAESIGASCTLVGVGLQDLNQAEAMNQRLTLVEAGDDVVLSAVIDLSEVPEEEDLDASVRVTFPGLVIDSSGPIDGQTVRWDLEPGQRAELEATARLLPSAQVPIPAWVFALVIGVVALVAVLIGAEWMQVRRR